MASFAQPTGETTPSAAPVAIIDWNEAVAMGGSEEFLQEVLEELMNESKTAEEEFQKTYNGVDLHAMMKAAHRIAGSASYFRCDDLVGRAAAIKHAAQQGIKVKETLGDASMVGTPTMLELKSLCNEFSRSVLSLRKEVDRHFNIVRAQPTHHMESVVTFLTSRLVPHGIDIVHPFEIQSYNKEAKEPLPTFEKTKTAAIVLGNSINLWTSFLEYLKSHPALLEHENPLDEYLSVVMQPVMEDLKAMLGDVHTEVRLSTGTMGCSSEFVDLLCAARVSGLAHFNPTCHLCLHPVYGPWWAMRAVLIFDMELQFESSSYPSSPIVINPIAELESELVARTQQLKEAGGTTSI